MFAYSFVLPMTHWGECVKWGNLSHSNSLERRCWGSSAWTFWMVTGTALLKVKMRKGTQYRQYRSIKRNSATPSISDDHPTLLHSLLWLFRWWWNACQVHSFLPGQGAKMNDRKRDPATATCQETWKGQASQSHPKSTNLPRCLFLPFDSDKITECQLSRGGRCLSYQMTSDVYRCIIYMGNFWSPLVNLNVKVNLSTMKNHGPQRALVVLMCGFHCLFYLLINRIWEETFASMILCYDLLSYTLSPPNFLLTVTNHLWP